MKILSRYILTEFLFPLCYCLTGFLSVYVLFELFGSFARIYEANLPFGMTARYFCGYLAPYFHFLAPAALMLATLYTMWGFCRHSELVAMRASGVSFLAIVWPLLTVALLMTAFVYYVNESYVPAHAHWASQMKGAKFDVARIKKADNVVYRNVSAARTWNIDEIRDAEAAHLGALRITADDSEGRRLRTITAERADYLDGEWWLTGAKVQHYSPLTGREEATTTPELDALPLRCFPEFTEEPADFVLQNRPRKFDSIRDRLRYLRTHPGLSAAERHECRYDIWAQALAPLACLIITLFAIPAGITSGRQSVFRGILGALVLYFSFYAVTIGCMAVVKNGHLHPVVGAVLPDVLFLALGIRAFRKLR